MTQDDKRASPARRSFLKGVGAVGAATVLPASVWAQEVPRNGGNLVVGMSGGATTDNLDPTIANAQTIWAILKQFTEQLVMASANGRDLEPRLAESWSHSDDFQTWNFKLRKGVTFHNGKGMTAKDVIYSLDRHRGPNSKSAAAAGLKSVSSIDAVSDFEISIKLTEPNVDFPFLLTDYHVVIQPDGEKGDSKIGTGPYAITDVRHGVRYLTTKYKNYWRKDVGHVDTIETLVINDNSARVSALLNGQVHLIDRVEPKIVGMISRTSTVRVVPTVGRGHYVFAMRCDQKPFDNPDVRMALKLAIDRDAMIKQILHGYGSLGNDSPINQAYPLYSKLTQRTYDPEKAAQFYKKSGHSGPIVLHTSEVAFGGAVDAAALYKEQAEKAGITIDVRREPADGYWDKVWNKEGFCATYWDGRPTQDQMLSLAYMSDAAWNETAWRRPDFDALILKSRREPNASMRGEIYKDATSMIRDDGGAIIPMFTQYLDGVSNKVGGYVPDVNNELSNGRFCERCWLKG